MWMDCIGENDIIDSILKGYKDDLGKDFLQYRNHVYRVYNFALPKITNEREINILRIAVAFHDLGIWTHNTFDYLKPSMELAKSYCLINGMDSDAVKEIERIIGDHHKLTKIKELGVAEIFRQADLIDLTLGLICKGVKRGDIRMIKRAFPNEGFHLKLGKLFILNLFRNPLSPLPMYKL